MKFLAAIDTNVFVSALLKADSNPGKIVGYIRDRKLIPVYNEEILSEYRAVLARKEKYDFTEDQQSEIINMVQEYGRVLKETETDEPFIHEDDIKFFQIVLTAREFQDSYLVTGNLKHYPKVVFVVDSATMVEIIEASK